jgi:uncharacterized protein (DUF1684 family)
LARTLTSALLVGLVVSTSACASAHSTPTTEPSVEFQRGYDQDLREDPTSFLTTVAAYYLGSGDTLILAAGERGWAEAELGSTSHGVRFIARPDALLVERDGARQSLDSGAHLALDDRFEASVSAQEQDWRVLIHDHDAARRTAFAGIAWFPVDPRWIVPAVWEPRATREPTLLQTSRGVSKTLYVAGSARFELLGAPAELLVFAYAAEPSAGEPMLIPFRDASSGRSSYAAGRYLELEGPTGASVVLDFNRATNPLCAYSEHYNCPMPPAFNRLEAAIEAGARAPDTTH